MTWRSRTAVALALAGLLGACSGGGKAPLSDAYVTKANALCAQWTKDLNDLGFNPPLSDVNRMVPFTKKLIALDTGYTDKFKALDATQDEKAALGPVYAAFDTINDAEAGVLKAAEAGDRVGIQTYHQKSVNTTTALNKQLLDLRLKICAS
ncbi:MAG TPA: hypothetical protein VFJ85_13375 [Acidimicrobiales bacterium]|nr:hypothetical protein [Acidimicrobiales bacterium]